jgi:hypothetical protein
MFKLLKIILLFTFVLLGTAEFTSVDAKEVKGVKISPSDVHEKCFEVLPTKVLYYSFESSKTVKFNLHYHLKERTVFPISGKATALKGVFNPEKKQKIYCLEWKNLLSSPVNLDYTYEVKDK